MKHVLVKLRYAREADFADDWDVELVFADETIVQVSVSSDKPELAGQFNIARDKFDQLATEWNDLKESTKPPF